MNVLEIKGSLYDIISKVEDKNLLLRIYDALEDVVKFNSQDSELSPTQQAALEAALEAAIQESLDDANLIDHEDAKKMHARWLKQ